LFQTPNTICCASWALRAEEAEEAEEGEDDVDEDVDLEECWF